MSETAAVVAHPAATVVLLRQQGDQCEVLLVQRSARLAFHGGAWVFPGGRLEAADYVGGDDVTTAARRAAVRETREEAGVALRADTLVLASRWITPAPLPKRFDTWFFAGLGDDSPIEVDGGEIHDHRWMTAHAALAAQRSGAIELPPPTFVTITYLAACQSAGDALAAFARGPVETFEPRLYPVEGGAVSLYAGDVAYADGELDRPGARHRLWMRESGWHYERGVREE
jgi:8-oxo-dGTP pyrophosphatase MutT (NUDIX family)